MAAFGNTAAKVRETYRHDRTLDQAADILARRFLNRPVEHALDSVAAPAEMIHHLLTVAPADRVGVVAALAGGDKRSLVFTRTKHGAQKFARQLAAAGIPAAQLHGNLAQGARVRNLASFASGTVRVMVATDIAARGIHVEGIDLVIHADPPTPGGHMRACLGHGDTDGSGEDPAELHGDPVGPGVQFGGRVERELQAR